MKTFLKVIMLVFTIIPLAYIGFFLASFANHDLIFDNFDLIFKLHGGTMIISLLLTIAYIIHIFKNVLLEESKRTQWIILILFGNIIAMPFYWFIHVRVTPKVELEESEINE